MAKKRFPILVTEWLKDLSMDEVTFLANLSRKKDIEVFYKFLRSEAERRKNIIYKIPEYEPTKLAIEKAALRGGVETLSTVFDMIQASPFELERRLKEDKNG
jgi:hypothetical protein